MQVGRILLMDELALGLARHELRDDEHLLGLLLKLLRQLLDRTVVEDVGEAVMHADGLTTALGAILAQVAQIRRQGEVVEVDVVIVDVPRAIGMDGDAVLPTG